MKLYQIISNHLDKFVEHFGAFLQYVGAHLRSDSLMQNSDEQGVFQKEARGRHLPRRDAGAQD